jgi:hypothetical protein
VTTAEASRGSMAALEQHRLSAHGVTTLENAGKLIDELLAMNVIPGPVARRLEVTRDDIRTAAEAKSAP